MHTQPWAEGPVPRMVLNVSRKPRRLVFIAFFQSQKLRLERVVTIPEHKYCREDGRKVSRSGLADCRTSARKHWRREPPSAGWRVLKC